MLTAKKCKKQTNTDVVFSFLSLRQSDYRPKLVQHTAVSSLPAQHSLLKIEIHLKSVGFFFLPLKLKGTFELMYHLRGGDSAAYACCIKRSFCCLRDIFLETQLINFRGGRVRATLGSFAARQHRNVVALGIIWS